MRHVALATLPLPFPQTRSRPGEPDYASVESKLNRKFKKKHRESLHSGYMPTARPQNPPKFHDGEKDTLGVNIDRNAQKPNLKGGAAWFLGTNIIPSSRNLSERPLVVAVPPAR